MGKYDVLIDEATSATTPSKASGKYDALIDEATSSTDLHNSLYEASGTNPDEEAKKLKLSKELNTPAALLPSNATEQSQLQRNRADVLQEKAPRTAKFLTKPENAKVTGLDGVDSLISMEEAHKTYSPDNIKTFIKNYTATGKTAAEASQKLSEMKKQGIDLNALVEDRYERTWSEAGNDVLKVMAAGSNLMVAGAVEAKRLSLQNQLHQLTLSLVSPKAAEESRAVDDAIDAQLQSNVKYWQEKKTPAVQELNEKLAKASTSDAIMLLAAHPALLVDQLALSAPYLLPAAGAARGGEAGMLLFNAVTEAMDAANSARQEAIQNGASVIEQDQAAGIAAMVTAPIAFLGNKLAGTGLLEAKFLTKGSTGHSLLSAAIREAISGAAEEGGNQLGMNIGAGLTHDQTRQLLAGVGKAAVLGGILEATHGVGMGSAQLALRAYLGEADTVLAKNEDRITKAAEAEATVATLASLGEQATANNLRTRSPEIFNEFVSTMAEDSNLTEVYVKGETALNAISGQLQALRTTTPELVQSIEEAVRIGGDVRISVPDYLTHLAGTPAEQALLPELRATPDGATYAEAQAFYDAQQEVFQQEVATVEERNAEVLSREEFNALKQTEQTQQTEQTEQTQQTQQTQQTEQTQQAQPLPATYEQYLQEHKNQREVYDRDVKQVEDKIYNQFQAAQRFTSPANRAYAAPLVEFYKTQAKNFGVTPSEMYARFPLKVQSFLNGTPSAELNQHVQAALDDFRKENIKDILTKEGWTILTAENPNKEYTPERNPALMQGLIQQLEAEGISYYLTDGKYGNFEKSVILFGITTEQALAIGRQHSQESVLTKDGLVYRDGSRNPATGVTVHDTVPEDYYTIVTFPDGTPSIFTIDLDFSQRIPAGEMAPVNPELIGATPENAEVNQGGKVGQVAVTGVHFSHAQRETLLGSYRGTGNAGREDTRVRQAKDRRIKQRIDFYVDEGKGIFPEPGLGKFKHVVTLNNMYDGSRNPLRLPTRDADGVQDMNLFESAVIDAGFDGYYVNGVNAGGVQGRAVLLGDAARAVTPDGLHSKEQIEARLYKKLENFDAAKQEYATRPDALNGKVLNTDTARELSPDYLANRSHAAAVHEPASDFIKQLYADKLAAAPAEGELPIVLFTAGGTGAGKTSALLQLDQNALADKQIIYDTNMATYESSKKKIDQALAAGKFVDIRLTIRDPIDGLVNGALPRAMRQEQQFGTGRPVPIKNHASTYLGAPETIQRLAEDYKGNPLVSIRAYDNSFGKGNAVEIDVANANKYVYNSQQELEDLLLAALRSEYEKGKISEAVARATAHTSRGNEEDKVIEGKAGQGLLGSAQKGGELNQSVSTRTPYAVGAENPHLSSGLEVGLESLNRAPGLKDKVAKIVSSYMTFKPGPKNTEGIIKNFIQQAEDNLLWVYDQVPDEVKTRSKKWYEGGSIFAERLVDRYNGRYSKAQMAASLAVMSPTMPWDINVSLSERLVDIYTVQQNTPWDDAMTRVTDAIAEKNPNRQALLDAIRDKTLAEVEGQYEKGAWMRVYDEAHNTRSYRSPTPEGGFGDIATTKAGKPSSVAYINGFGPIAKLVSVLEDGSMSNISRQLGEAHKVRNFYNNIFDPNDAKSVTIDTHAVAVGLLLPLGASSIEVMHALNGTGGSNAEQGLTGTYALFAEAYRRAAAKRGVLPREMQSITWEAGRGLFNAAFKGAHKKNPKQFSEIWGAFTSGKATIDETRQKILGASGGIQDPAWTKFGTGLYEGSAASSYTGELLSPRGVERALGRGDGDGTAEGVSLNQGARGSFNLDTLTMTLLQGADLSTVIHESGHFYLKMLQDLGTRPDAPARVSNDYKKVLDWFGVTQRAWETMTLEQQRPYHEQWAESFELWNMEGQAPTQQLQPVMSRFRAWLLSVYKSVEDFLRLHPAAGKLNDEVRAVFGRLMASEEAIRATEEARGYMPLFNTAQEAGVSDKAFEDYLALGREATQQSVDALQARSLRDMRWLSNARNEALKKIQAQAKVTRAKIAAEVAQEVNAEPVNQARAFLKSGETRAPNGDIVKISKGYKLDTGILKEMYPESALDTPDLSKLRGLTSNEGLAPDLVARMFGFTSGDAMVRELIAAENVNDKIEGLTDQRMLEEHGDLIDEKSVARAADEAVHNDARAKFMATGLKMLSNSPLSVAQMTKAAKQAADNTIANKKVRDLRPKQYLAAESRANKNVLKLVAKDPSAAAVEQRAALLNNRLAASAQDAVTEVEKALRYLGKFNNEGTRKNLDLEYLEQIDALLEPFDLRKGLSLTTIDARTSLAEWLGAQEAMGFEPTIDPVEMATARLKSYKDMTMEDMRGLVDTIKQIEHMGRMKKKLLTAREHADFMERITAAKLSIAENANRVAKERGTPSDTIGHLGQWVRQALAMHRKLSSFMRELDGGKDNGVMFNLFVKPMAEASSLETEMKAQATEVLAKLFEPIQEAVTTFGNFYAPKRVVPGTDISMTHEERIMFAMNWGNEGNRQRLLDGGLARKKALSPNEAEAILSTLTKEEWDFVQGVWDFIGTYRPLIEAQERELTGKTPEWLAPAEVMTKFGTYPGGYFPAKYDVMLSTRSDALEAVTDLRSAMKGAFGAAAARNGYTKARADAVVGRPLLLSFNTISRHVNEVIHRLAWQSWLIDANRIVRALDPDLRTYLGAEATKEIADTVRDIAAGDAPAVNALQVGINRVRTGTSIVGMGWKISTAMLQVTGLSVSWSRLGARHMAKGLARYLAHPLETSDWVNENSALMRHRGRTLNREMNEILNTVRGGKKASAITASYFYLIGKMQRTVDIPTYLGAYEKSLEEQGYEAASSAEERSRIEQQAHAIAAQTVIDTQGGGELKDLAKVQRGSPLDKLFTNFYSYMSMVYNLNVEAYRTTDFKSPSEIGIFAADMILINFIPVVMAAALKNALKGHCEWDDLECLAGRYKSEQVSHLFGLMVGVREIGTAADALTGGEAYGYTGPAGLRFFTDVYKSAEQMHQGEADMALFKAVNNASGALFHYPAGQINNVLEGAIAIEEGQVEGIGILPALIAGAPR